ncbi:tRNA threonylcarbamoyladenosine dehydratase [Kushneria aurantia]|uniref:ThiF family adenylyltransferase n=1 Tax=Kushneria aurantia TaxID=504092 RepID=A0ABV6G1A3_9GAMM|nr:tRNA threonylcarbamoyladenosine dehydratase [Kushneria aurantia]
MNDPIRSPTAPLDPRHEADFAARFDGLRRLYGQRGVAHLRRAHVVVIGIGGVGSWSVEALARSGFERLSLIDLDDVCVTNINRQLHALDGTVGRPKTAVMAERCRLINPWLEVRELPGFVTPDNIARMLPEDCDHVIDAIDHAAAKCALIDHCRRRRIGITITGAAGGLTDPTRITLADLTRTEHDPLLAKVRSRLRRDYGYSRNPKRRFSLPCVYSPEQRRFPDGAGEVCNTRPPNGEALRLGCSAGYGSATFVTGAFGFAAVSHAIDNIIARGERAEAPAAADSEQE